MVNYRFSRSGRRKASSTVPLTSDTTPVPVTSDTPPVHPDHPSSPAGPPLEASSAASCDDVSTEEGPTVPLSSNSVGKNNAFLFHFKGNLICFFVFLNEIVIKFVSM